jgi:hypothetical protein
MLGIANGIGLSTQAASGSLRLKPEFAGGTLAAELRPPDVASHGRQTAMAGVTHDLFIRDPVLVGRGNEPGAHTVRHHRFHECAFDPGGGRAAAADLAHGVRVKALAPDRVPSGYPPEDRAIGYLRRCQPGPQRPDRTGFASTSFRDADLFACAGDVGTQKTVTNASGSEGAEYPSVVALHLRVLTHVSAAQ